MPASGSGFQPAAIACRYFGSVFAPNHKGMLVLDKDNPLDFLHQQVLTSRNVKASLGFLVEIIVATGTCLVLGFGGQLAISGGLSAGVLIVSGERPLPAGLQDARIHRLEIPHGHFERRIELQRFFEIFLGFGSLA